MQLRHIIFGIRSDPGGDDDVVRDALRRARCVRIQSGEGELRNKPSGPRRVCQFSRDPLEHSRHVDCAEPGCGTGSGGVTCVEDAIPIYSPGYHPRPQPLGFRGEAEGGR